MPVLYLASSFILDLACTLLIMADICIYQPSGSVGPRCPHFFFMRLIIISRSIILSLTFIMPVRHVISSHILTAAAHVPQQLISHLGITHDSVSHRLNFICRTLIIHVSFHFSVRHDL
jgi:hypothetical protein